MTCLGYLGTALRLAYNAVAKQAAQGLRALAEHLEKDDSLTTAAADRMAIDFYQNR